MIPPASQRRMPSAGGEREKQSERESSASWHAIGTSVRLVVTEPSKLATGRLLLASYIDALDLACSRFRSDSELIRAERSAGTPVQVSELLADAVAVALHAAQVTGGDLDPTVGLQLAELGYDRDFALVAKDGPPVRVTVRIRPTWRDVRLERDSCRLTLPPGTRLDLGATAKAYAADRAAARLAGRLDCGVLVSLGGDIAIGGDPPPGGWRIRIQDITGHPDESPVGPSQVIALTSGGVSSSGVAARRWRRGDLLLHHILDPRTGMPAKPVWRTVSVLAGSATEANIASTTAIIRGAAAPAWLDSLHLAARLVATDGGIQHTSGWPESRGDQT
jgi:thiamine biosynthesis lipoprotein ApbE